MSSAPYKPFARGYGILFGIVSLWLGWLLASYVFWTVLVWIRQSFSGGEGA